MNRLAAPLAFVVLTSLAAAQAPSNWAFAVSGDSRNCGDIVMPVIAAKARAEKAAFYWHLGDFRALYDFDQDILAANHGKLTISDYQAKAWPDFIDRQLAPFGDTPVLLALGNHELVSRTRPDIIVQFADWFDAPAIRAQRLADNPNDHVVRTYYHLRKDNVDFITVDNASAEQFDTMQLKWIKALLEKDADDATLSTVVIGMHDALPDSLTAGHSMNESAAGIDSGHQVYDALLKLQRSGKEVHVLASHSHFVLSEPYKTSCRKPEDVLSGWIIGTAGAIRYRLPPDHHSEVARTDVYGYLLATVTPEGHVTFAFHEIKESEISESELNRYGKELIHSCFAENKSPMSPASATCPTQ